MGEKLPGHGGGLEALKKLLEGRFQVDGGDGRREDLPLLLLLLFNDAITIVVITTKKVGQVDDPLTFSFGST